MDNQNALREGDLLAKQVARHMLESGWTQHYGLSYKDTMALPYSEWALLQKALDEKIGQTPPPTT